MNRLRQNHRSLLFCLFLLPGLVFGSDDVIVVLSSNLKPYQEALSGFRQENGGHVTTLVLADGEPEIPPNVRVVVAIGGKAALYPYPSRVRLVYCMAPGLLVKSDGYKNQPIKIHTSPSLFVIASKFKAIQPSLKHLGVPWISDSIKDYLTEKEKVSTELGIEIIATHLRSSDDLPDYLRASKGKIDGLWLPPDPTLITAQSLAIIKGFSWANNIPFYVPTESLMGLGATASVSSSYSEIGRTAARIAAMVLTGAQINAAIYPERIRININEAAAKESGLVIPLDVIKATQSITP